MHRLIKREMMEIGPEMAGKFLQFNTYVTQRKLRPAHADELTSKMKEGTFRFGEIAFAQMNGNKYMMNGQHVCTSIVNSGLSQMCVVELFQCDNDVDMSKLFKQFEILPRSIADMVAVENHALKLDWPSWFASIVVAAAGIIEVGNASMVGSKCTGAIYAGHKAMTKEQRVNLLGKYVSQGSFVKRILIDTYTSGDIKHMKRSALVAMMFKTFKISESDSEIFWIQVRDGENLTKKMPAWHLREFLVHHNIISHRNAMTYRKVTNHEIGYRSALTWNAFRRGAEISKTSYYPEKDIPALK